MAFVLPLMFAFGIPSIFYLLVVLCALLEPIVNAALRMLVSIELAILHDCTPVLSLRATQCCRGGSVFIAGCCHHY